MIIVNKIKYRFSTCESIICHKCKKSCKGKEGYLCINYKDTDANHYETDIRLCYSCLKKELNKKKEGNKIYSDLIKKKVLKNLK